MKRIIKNIVFLLASAIIASCSDDKKGEVISQDLSYDIDKDYVFVDIPPAFDFNPSNIVYLQGKTILTIHGMHGDDQTSIKEGNRYEFNIKLKRVLDHEVTVRLKEDPTLLDEFTSAANYLPFPNSTVSIPDITIPKGSMEGTAVLTFQNVNLLKELPGYILPLRLELIDESKDVDISTVNYSIFIQLDMEFGKDNIELSNDPIEGIEFNDIITFDSDKKMGLHYLNDGDLKNNSWYPKNRYTYLTMTLPEPMKILGFKINIKSGSTYALGKFNVFVTEKKGEISYGKVERNVKNNAFNIRFKKAVEISAIKLDEMLTIDGGSGPDIYEINFIK